eukprot:scaffold25199_cov152-Cylindrotheca_fusiformis.AAC.5
MEDQDVAKRQHVSAEYKDAQRCLETWHRCRHYCSRVCQEGRLLSYASNWSTGVSLHGHKGFDDPRLEDKTFVLREVDRST